MDDYVSKPIRVEELREALCRGVLQNALASENNEDKEISENTAIDLSVLESLCEMAGEEASLLLEEMIASYLEDTQIRLQAIAKAIEQADAETIHQAAHSMKSSSANLGADNLARLCEELEQLGRNKTIERTQDLLSNAESEYQQVISSTDK